jgi:excinuclease ABC subunit C
MSRTVGLETIRTASELEALLAEARLIRSLQPRYNKELKDDKSYPMLKVTEGDDFPWVEIVREEPRAGGRYYGPFADVGGLRRAVEALQTIFRFRTCTLDLRADDPKLVRNRPCLLYHIDRCTAPCAGKAGRPAYGDEIRQLLWFLDGKRERLLRGLRRGMRTAAAGLRYEKAARLRDRIASLERLRSASGAAQGDGSGAAGVLPIRPQDAVEDLRKVLGCRGGLGRIEGVDIATLGGSASTGAVVTFVDGIPHRAGYRHFRIRTVRGVDDFGMLREVVFRRFRRLLEEGDLPGLLLVDGGKGQLEAAHSVFRELGVEGVRLVALAKREELLYVSGSRGALRLPRNRLGLRLLQFVRDEAHRFSRRYHHRLRSKGL